MRCGDAIAVCEEAMQLMRWLQVAVGCQREHIERVLDVLENKGIEFIEFGVRLTKRSRR